VAIPGFARRFLGWAWLAAFLLAAAPCWAGDGAASAGPATPDVSAPTRDQTIYTVIGLAHSDLVIPRAAFGGAPPRLKAAVGQLGDGDWVIIGWGPYWFGRDERMSTGGRAASLVWCLMTPQQGSRLRLAAIAAPGSAPKEGHLSLIPIRVTADGLDHALAQIDRSFSTGPDGGPVITYRPATEPGVVIFRSDQHYNVTHECNHWVAEVLRAGGVAVPPGLDLVPALIALSLKTVDASETRRPPVAVRSAVSVAPPEPAR